MKKVMIVLSLLFLVGCGEQTLTVRSTLEGDSYLRNNLHTLTEEQFLSFASVESDMDTETYEAFKQRLYEHEQTRYVLMDERIYRYTVEDELLYVADWVEENGIHKLDNLVFP
ncbi:hypothetical protein [Shouchella hunanensis]|uniref:Lipoprotein n=1 Tax=Shouchella hunanensis TaxID=766894 RepID=A0ABY7W8I6_9BACI|nr:hypothetical protein [Shouchella hunanensis]WDF05237.1 hypothetical protein PQ477_07145 [Shouchella hunanensis]